MIRKSELDNFYRQYNRREYVHPDPLEFLYDYPDPADGEIVGVVASSLAYGRVSQILQGVRTVLDRLGESPCDYVSRATPSRLRRDFSGFKHRFTTGAGIVSLLLGVRNVIREYGSLNECALSGMGKRDRDILPGLSRLVHDLACEDTYLIPLPERGSACKRLNLFLRWMVREDQVDPGGWHGIPRSKLIVPLDTHMAAIGQSLKLTQRRTANMRMACEITEAFREFSPRDPVKYDFCLTRFGIRDEMNRADVPGLLID